MTSLTVRWRPRPKVVWVFQHDRGEQLMGNVVDLGMVRYLIQQFGLPVAEAVRVDMVIAAEYGLVPAPPPPARDQGSRRGFKPGRRVRA